MVTESFHIECAEKLVNTLDEMAARKSVDAEEFKLMASLAQAYAAIAQAKAMERIADKLDEVTDGEGSVRIFANTWEWSG